MRSWSQDPQGYIEDRSIPVPFSGCWLWTESVTDTKNKRTGETTPGYGAGYMGNYVQRLAHILAYEAYSGPVPKGMHVCHTCDMRSCVNPAHLFLGTHVDNMRDRDAKGRAAKGARQHLAKLTDALVLAIRADVRLFKEVAADYGISPSTVSDVKHRRTWKHLHAA
jgi:hypothetical protein